MAKVGIVVLHWNDVGHTRECLDSVLELEGIKSQIYLVDNFSTNGSLDLLKQAYRQVRFIELKENLGFAKGMNAGMKMALAQGNDSICLLNNDILLEKKSLELMMRLLESGDGIGVVVPMVLEGKSGSVISSIGGEISWRYGEARHIGQGKMDDGKWISQPVEYAPASALLVKAEAVKKAGFIPEEYFLYSEDVDWSMQVKEAGFKILTEPKALVWHDESSSSGKGSPLKSYYYTRNLMYFMGKYTRNFRWVSFLVWFHWKLFKLMIKYVIKGEFSLIKASWSGYGDFWRGKMGLSKKYEPRMRW